MEEFKLMKKMPKDPRDTEKMISELRAHQSTQELNVKDIPESFSWLDKGAVTQVRNQACTIYLLPFYCFSLWFLLCLFRCASIGRYA